MMWFVGIMAIVMVVGITLAIQDNNKKNLSFDNALKNLNNFEVSQSILSIDKSVALLLDENNKKLCFLLKANPKIASSSYQFKYFNFNDVISSEIVEDGHSILKSSRTSQLGSALIGGIALGGVGAIVGGLTGKKKNVDKVKNVDLVVVVNDMSYPSYSVNLLKIEVKKSSFAYRTAAKNAKHWHDIFSIIIKNEEKSAV